MSRRGPGVRAALSAIALNTFREAVRDRVFYLMLVFAIILIGASRLLAILTVGSEVKIVKDIGLSALSIFGVLTAAFVGVSLVFKEIEKRTIHTLLANPVRRWQFIVGKFVGLSIVLAVNVAVMAIVLSVAVLLYGESPIALAPSIALILVELWIIAGFAILFSSYTNPILAAIGTASVYVVGHLSWSFELLGDRVGTVGALLCDVLSWVVPNLDRLDVKAQVVHGVAVGPGYVASGVLYGLGYTAVVLVAACVVFERRDFT